MLICITKPCSVLSEARLLNILEAFEKINKERVKVSKHIQNLVKDLKMVHHGREKSLTSN